MAIDPSIPLQTQVAPMGNALLSGYQAGQGIRQNMQAEKDVAQKKKLQQVQFLHTAAKALRDIRDPTQRQMAFVEYAEQAKQLGMDTSRLGNDVSDASLDRVITGTAAFMPQMTPYQQAQVSQGNALTNTMFAPMPAFDAQGNPVFVQGSRSGGLTPIDGYRPYTPTVAEKTDAAVDEFGRKQGIKLATEPRIAGASRAAEAAVDLETKPGIAAATTGAKNEATAGAEAADELRRAQAALPGLRETVSSLKELSKLATYTTTGKAFDLAAKELGFGGTKGSTARAKMVSVVDNQVLPLLRDTFGAAFTAAEGERLRDTLLDPDASPEAREAQLNAFMDQKVRDIETKQRQLGIKTQPRLAPDDQAAIDWARANPNDPRAAQIMQLHGGR